MKTKEKISIALGLLLAAAVFLPVGVFAQTTADQLQGAINQKNSELQQIQNQRDALQTQLNKIYQSNKTLKSEIDGINYKINQLDLQQKSNRLTVEKLNLEINSMATISAGRNRISKKEGGDWRTFPRDAESRPAESSFIVMQTGGLSESVSRANETATLNVELAKSIAGLRALQEDLSDKLETESQRKRQEK